MKKKSELKRDKVESTGFHVGIELELVAPCEGGSGHDDDACLESQREYFNDLGTVGILRDYECLSRDQANAIAPYFNEDAWIDSYMEGWECDGDCSFRGSGDDVRDEIRAELKALTGNASFKVVEDGSIHPDDDETDAEVCWNYYASKETIKDNEKILKYLTDRGCDFNKRCGLHINLNNYLNVSRDIEISKDDLAFLFNFVAPSRRESTYCTRSGMHGEEKYSMIYNQGDRLEFRFFSPTLDAEKLNHYVTLAHTIYKRLAGKNAKLPKRTADYLLEKMVKLNEVPKYVAMATINKVNALKSARDLDVNRVIVDTSQPEFVGLAAHIAEHAALIARRDSLPF